MLKKVHITYAKARNEYQKKKKKNALHWYWLFII